MGDYDAPAHLFPPGHESLLKSLERFVGFYTRIIFPHVCNGVLGGLQVAERRRRLLAEVRGDKTTLR